MSQDTQTGPNSLGSTINNRVARGCLERLYKNASMILVVIIVGAAVFAIARASFTKFAPTREDCTCAR